MKGSTGQAIGSQNRFVRDKLVGKMVVIVGGPFKGHRGRVTYADDKQATVEMSSQCKKIPIDKALVKLLEEENGGPKADGSRSNHGGASMYAGGQTIYDGAKTPMNKYTPSHYPQSAWGGGAGDNFDNNDNQYMAAGNANQYSAGQYDNPEQLAQQFKAERSANVGGSQW